MWWLWWWWCVRGGDKEAHAEKVDKSGLSKREGEMGRRRWYWVEVPY